MILYMDSIDNTGTDRELQILARTMKNLEEIYSVSFR